MTYTKKNPNRIDPARKRWVKTSSLEFIHYDIPDGSREAGEGSWDGWGNTQIVSVSKGKKLFSFDLSELTLEEMEVVEEFFLKVMSEAKKVCEHRDGKAQEAWDNGDDSHFRLYRTVPRLVERTREKQQHDPGVSS